MKRYKITLVVQYFIAYLSAIIILIPIINMLLSGFKTNAEINRATFIPSQLYIENYIAVTKTSYALFSFVNSTVITGLTLIIAIFACSTAAYPLGRNIKKIYNLIYLFFLSSMMIPVASNLVPLYILVKNLGLIDTRLSMILISSANAIPMGILLYTGFIKTVPRQLDESAVIDGCNYLQRYWLIIFPLLKPVTISFAVLSSIGVWNDFLTPMLFLRSNIKKTIILAVYAFQSEHTSDWGAIYAFLTVALIPPLLFFLLMHKHFYKGITVGALKG